MHRNAMESRMQSYSIDLASVFNGITFELDKNNILALDTVQTSVYGHKNETAWYE